MPFRAFVIGLAFRYCGRAVHFFLFFCIFIDALGWELAERYRFCADFLPFRYDIVMQLGYSAGARAFQLFLL